MVWQKAHVLVLEVYRMTAGFPHEERYGLISQMRRAAVSVPANIAEGFRKRSSKDQANFYNMAHGSLEELRYYLILTADLGYATVPPESRERIDEVSRMLYGLAASARARSQARAEQEQAR
jgi:four helix bundle protein